MIRKFQEDDLDRVMQLWLSGNLEAHPFIPETYWISQYETVREQIPQADVFLYETEGVICGFVGLIGRYIAGIFVEKTCRAQGIGSLLLAYIKARSTAFSLQVYRDNQRAVAFYLREGFSVVSGDIDADTGAYALTMAWERDSAAANDWEHLYRAAMQVLRPREISPRMEAGGVAAALLTKGGQIYTGVCIDTACSLGMCAERNAIAHMLTCGEQEIVKILAVDAAGNILVPCGACREAMLQLGGRAEEIELLTDAREQRVRRLGELLPEWWGR